MVSEAFGSIAFSDRKIELMYQAAKEQLERMGGDEQHMRKQLQSLLTSLTEKESKLLEVFLAEQISKELYDRKVSDIQRERIVLNKQLKEIEGKEGLGTLEPTKKLFQQANKAQKEFLDADDEKKRQIVEQLLWNLSIENKSMASIQYKSPFHIMAKTPKNASFSKMLTVSVWNHPQ